MKKLTILYVLFGLIMSCNQKSCTTDATQEPSNITEKSSAKSHPQIIESKVTKTNDTTYLITWTPPVDSNSNVFIETKSPSGAVIRYPQQKKSSSFSIVSRSGFTEGPIVYNCLGCVGIEIEATIKIVDIDIIMVKNTDNPNFVNGEIINATTPIHNSDELIQYLQTQNVTCNSSDNINVSYYVSMLPLSANYFETPSTISSPNPSNTAFKLYEYQDATRNEKINHDDNVLNIINSYFMSNVSFDNHKILVVRRFKCN